MQALLDNKVQMLAPSLSKLIEYSPKLEVFDLPFLFDDDAAVARFQKREASRELLRSMAGRGIYGLAYWNNGLKQMTANQPLRNPADAAGLAFRIQPSPVLEAYPPHDGVGVAVAVLVENGGDAGQAATGGSVAAPIGRAVINAAIQEAS